PDSLLPNNPRNRLIRSNGQVLPRARLVQHQIAIPLFRTGSGSVKDFCAKLLNQVLSSRCIYGSILLIPSIDQAHPACSRYLSQLIAAFVPLYAVSFSRWENDTGPQLPPHQTNTPQYPAVPLSQYTPIVLSMTRIFPVSPRTDSDF